MFRYKKSAKVGYIRQGYIYFYSRMYQELDADAQRYIEQTAALAAGNEPEYAPAVLRYVTSDDTPTKICEEHHLSRATLHRAVARYYELF